MGNEQRDKVLKVALAGGALVIIGAGVVMALAGEAYGWAVAAFGVLDLATVPFIVRMIGSKRGGAAKAPAAADSEEPAAAEPPAEGTSDPSYNPYARED